MVVHIFNPSMWEDHKFNSSLCCILTHFLKDTKPKTKICNYYLKSKREWGQEREERDLLGRMHEISSSFEECLVG
jgi:hypothetical protein